MAVIDKDPADRSSSLPDEAREGGALGHGEPTEKAESPHKGEGGDAAKRRADEVREGGAVRSRSE